MSTATLPFTTSLRTAARTAARAWEPFPSTATRPRFPNLRRLAWRVSAAFSSRPRGTLFLFQHLARRTRREYGRVLSVSASENKKLLEAIYAGMAVGDSRLLVESMAEDFRWILSGQISWSRVYEGKAAVLAELFKPLRDRIEGRIKTIPTRIIAEDDIVVVEAHGDNVTRKGARYDNRYCFVYRVRDGKLAEVTEYMDTDLVVRALAI
jgi:ketosteroid isomerase-like protein